MLEGANGPQVMEVNSSPGLEGIEGATGLDLAGEIIDYIMDQVQFPEIDIRQRLTVSRGYSVADINIPEGSKYVGVTLEQTGMRELDVVVLTLRRKGMVVSNPKSTRVLEADDSLLCYGKSEHMKGLIPNKSKKRRKVSRLKQNPPTDPPAA